MMSSRDAPASARTSSAIAVGLAAPPATERRRSAPWFPGRPPVAISLDTSPRQQPIRLVGGLVHPIQPTTASVPTGRASRRYTRAVGGSSPSRSWRSPSRSLRWPRHAPQSRILVADSFSRVSPSGWRTADKGGRYAHAAGRAGFGVDGSKGVIRMRKRGRHASRHLTRVVARDVDLKVRVGVDRLPAGDGATVAAVLRRTTAGDEYRVRMRLHRDGSVRLALSRVHSGQVVDLVGEQRVQGARAAAGEWFWLRVTVRGARRRSSTSGCGPRGDRQPRTWQLTHLDGDGALTSPGDVGVQAGLSSEPPRAVSFRFDDLRVRRLGAQVDSAPSPRVRTSGRSTSSTSVGRRPTSRGRSTCLPRDG